MEKYLGNKRVLLSTIGDFVALRCPTAKSVCDIFAGTTNIGRYFRQKGYDVVSNDINRFSYVLGSAYLATRTYPLYSGTLGAGRSSQDLRSRIENLSEQFFSSVRKDAGALFPASRAEQVWLRLAPTAEVLARLSRIAEGKPRTTRILDHFTATGRHSDYKSVRGTTGKRNYFSQSNATALNLVLDQLREWWQERRLTIDEVFVLLTAVLEEVVIVANVNGTFHDFNRERLWPNALQPFTLRVPLISATGQRIRLHCDDAIRIAPHVGPHDILYIDPPYNFRQYTAYYHLLNFVAAYVFLDDLDSYLGELQHVRGQNMKDDFTSDFCFRSKFPNALRALIDGAPCRYVVMSYYGGRNHWNHWADTEHLTDEGLNVLNEIFFDRELFSNAETVNALQIRQNYQSRNGERKSLVREHLIFGEKRHIAVAKTENPARFTSDANLRLGLGSFC